MKFIAEALRPVYTTCNKRSTRKHFNGSPVTPDEECRLDDIERAIRKGIKKAE